jgi:hypothetical protein
MRLVLTGGFMNAIARGFAAMVLLLGPAVGPHALADGPSLRWDQVAEADARVSSADPLTNFGSEDFLATGRGSQTYFRVDIPQPTTRAVLKLFPLSSGPGSNIFLTSDDWDEQAITWNSRPALGQYVGSTGPVQIGEWVEIDVTAFICSSPPLVVCHQGPVSFALTGRGTTEYASREHWLLAGPRLVLYVGG